MVICVGEIDRVVVHLFVNGSLVGINVAKSVAWYIFFRFTAIQRDRPIVVLRSGVSDLRNRQLLRVENADRITTKRRVILDNLLPIILHEIFVRTRTYELAAHQVKNRFSIVAAHSNAPS